MQLKGSNLRHVTTITHEGKVLLFGISDDRRIWFTVRQSGFEESALAGTTLNAGFENWREVPLNESVPDSSVLEREDREYKSDNGTLLLHSVYRGDPLAEVVDAPIQLVSSRGHVHLFRQSVAGTLLAQRFVLDGMTNQLIPKFDVRFRRSRQKHNPYNKMKKGGKGLDSADSLGFKDMDGKFFYEPTTELRFIENLKDGWFAALLLPTQDHDIDCWNIFAFDGQDQKLELYSVRGSAQGLFDISDHMIEEAGPENPTELAYRSIPGITRRTMVLKGMSIANGPSATTYYRQVEVQTDDGPRLLKEAARVMLAVPVKRDGTNVVTTAAMSFAIALDGTLSKIDLAPDMTEIHKATIDEVLLPLTTLDDIKVIADATPPPAGIIQSVSRAEDDSVRIVSQDAPAMPLGSVVRIRETQNYNGLYRVKAVDGYTFEIEAKFQYDEPGFWEVVADKEDGLVYDDMIVGYEKTADGLLKVYCSTHTLNVGDEVQVQGLRDYNGTYPVTDVNIDDRSFTVNFPWRPGDAVDLKSIKRRGVCFDGDGDHLRAYELELGKPHRMADLERTMSAWIRVDGAHGNRQQILLSEENELMRLEVGDDNRVALHVHMSDGSERSVVAPEAMNLDCWEHYAGALRYDTQNDGCYTLSLYRDGKLVASLEELALRTNAPDLPGPPAPFLEFDGKDDAIELPTIQADFSKGLALEAWVRFDHIYSCSRIIDLGNGPNPDKILLSSNGFNNALSFQLSNGQTLQVLTPAALLEAGVWTHVAATVDASGNATIYINGEAVVSNAMVLPPQPLTLESNYLGKSNSLDDVGFAGGMTEVRLWNRPRTQAEIQADMSRRITGQEAGLVAYWPLDAAAGHREIEDKGPAALHGQVSGDPALVPGTSLQSNPLSPIVTTRQVMKFPESRLEVPVPSTIHAPFFTISCWVRASSGITMPRTVLSRGDTLGFFAMPQKEWCFAAPDGTDVCAIGAPLVEDKWTHLTMTYDGKLRAYVDGVLIGEQATLISPLTGIPLRIGHGCETLVGSQNEFVGQIAEVRLYNTVLSIAEIKHDMYRRLRGDEFSLKGYWPLDGLPLATYPDVVSGGTFLTTPQLDTVDTLPLTELPGYIQFNGSDARVEIPSFTNKTQAVTLSCWAKSNTATWGVGGGALISKTNAFFIQAIADTKSVRFNIYSGGWQYVECTVPDIQNWHHYAGTFDGQTLRVYYDGALQAEVPFTGGIDAQASVMYIGMYDLPGNVQYFSGQLAHATVWDHARTAAQLQDGLWNNPTGQEAGLVGYWRLLANDLADHSPNARHGLLRGIGAFSAAAPRPFRNYLEFDGKSDWIDVPYQRGFSSPRFTISCWVKLDAGAQTWRTPVMCQDISPRRGFALQAHATNQWTFSIGTSGASDHWATLFGPAVVEGVWTHLAGTYDGQTMRLYVDGLLVGAQDAPLSPNTEKPLRIGADATEQPNPNDFFPGTIAEVRMYSVAQSESEIVADMYRCLAGNEPNLVGYWPLDTVSGPIPARDLAPAALDGIVQGAPELMQDPDFMLRDRTTIDIGAAPMAPAPFHLQPLLVYFLPRSAGRVTLPGAWQGLDLLPPEVQSLTSYTLEAWFRAPAENVNCQLLFALHENGAPLLDVGFSANGELTVRHDPTQTPVAASSAIACNDDHWHHIAVVVNPAAVVLYLDGKPISKQSGMPAPAGPVEPFIVIGGDSAKGFFTGNLADVRLWGVARTEKQVFDNRYRRLTGNEYGLLGVWMLEQVEFIDFSPYRNHLVPSPDLAWEIQPANFLFPAPCLLDAGAFDGASNWVSFEHALDLAEEGATMGREFAVEFWARNSMLSASDACLFHARGAQGELVIDVHLSAAGELVFCAGDQADASDRISVTLPMTHLEERWVHWAFVKHADDGVMRILCNGKLVASGDGKNQRLPAIASFALSAHPDGRDFYAGSLADVRLWSRARTPEDVRRHCTRRLPGDASDLLASYRFGATTVVEDQGSAKRHGVYMGTPKPVEAPFPELDRWTPDFFMGGMPEIGDGRYFRGKLSDVRVWNCVQPEAEMRDTMHLMLTGKELELSGYWRMGGVVLFDGKRIVPDFSVHGKDADAFGDVYVSARTLERATRGGLKAVKYTNEELVAVSPRAVYEESFEFKVATTNPSFDVNNADGTGQKLFDFTYFGKRSRHSDDVIQIPEGNVIVQDFQDQGGGWYKAVCRIVIPDDLRLLRTFGIDAIRGIWKDEPTPPPAEWTAIDVRKHRIVRISDAISQENYTDPIALPETIGVEAEGEARLAEVQAAEGRMDGYAGDVQYLAALLEIARNSKIYTDEIARLQAECDASRATITRRRNRRNQINGDWTRFYYQLCPNNAPGMALTATNLPDLGVYGKIFPRGYDEQKFRFQSAPGGTYHILTKSDNLYLTSGGDGYGVTFQAWNGYANQRWNGSPGANDSKYSAPAGEWFLDVRDRDTSAGTWVITFRDMGNRDNQKWDVVQTSELAAWAATELDQIAADIAKLEAKIRQNEARIGTLRAILAGIRDMATLAKELEDARAGLSEATSEYYEANTRFLEAIAAQNRHPQSMSLLRQDRRGLRTLGAELGFVRPLDGIHASESIEGEVHLTYLDDAHRLRLTRYDATADTRNAAYEEWIPDRLRACIECREAEHKVVPEAPIPLRGPQWTIETWFAYPAAAKPSTTSDPASDPDYGLAYEYSVIAASDDDNSCPLVIKNGSRLGMLVDGFFYDSGYALDQQLSAGWHHVAVASNRGRTAFFIDGQQVGVQDKSRYGLEFGGGNDGVVIEKIGNFPATAFTVTLWIRAAPENPLGTILHYSKDGTDKTLTIEDPGNLAIHLNNEAVTFDEPVALNDNTWHHLAISWNSEIGDVSVYVDGQFEHKQLIAVGARIPSGGTMLLAQCKMPTGDNQGAFVGTLGDLSLWSVSKKQLQIQMELYDLFTGTEENLIGHWNFQTRMGENGLLLVNSVKATSTVAAEQPRHGQILGRLDPVVLAPGFQGDITVIGNRKGGNAPAGRLAEMRFWEAALSEEELLAHSHVRLTGYEPGLATYYPFSEGTGSTVRNHAVNAASDPNHAESQGAQWIACTAPMGDMGAHALCFDGQTNYVDLAPITSDIGKRMSFEAWVKAEGPNATLTPRAIFTQKEQTDDDDHRIGFSLHISEPGRQLMAGFYDPGTPEDTGLGVGWEGVVDPGVFPENEWVHVAVTYDGDVLVLYRNGQEVVRQNGFDRSLLLRDDCPQSWYIGRGAKADSPRDLWKGQMSEMRVWKRVRPQVEIAHTMSFGLRGDEADLAGYWTPTAASLNSLKDLSGHLVSGTIEGVVQKSLCTKLTMRGVVAGEYSAMTVHPADPNRQQALMRRFYAYVNPAGAVHAIPGQRIEELTLQWVGNAQLNPTIQGYIEGAPPVPSENLTEYDDYAGATSVQLNQSEDVSYTWSRSDDSSKGIAMDFFAGASWEFGVSAMVAQSKVAEGKVGFKGDVSVMNSSSKSSTSTFSSSLNTSDSLELFGTLEREAKFPHLGRRYVPKNVGYALVISGMADVFVSKLRRSGRMVGYEIRPVEGMEPDVNTITFMMNPAYTLNGSLDGMVGSRAADDRFYAHVPDMRAQYGSLYAASYFRLKQAYDLKKQIERQDADREAFFHNFDLGTLALPPAMLGGFGDISDYGDTPVVQDDSDDEKLSEPERKAREKARAKALKKNSAKQGEALREKSAAQQEKIDEIVNDPNRHAEATAGLEAWQSRMEALRIKAGKHNIVNTYVWDADGGLHAESQSFAETIEHSVSSGFSFDAGGGVEVDIMAGVFAMNITALGRCSLSQTVSKTESTSRGFSLDINLGGIERAGITDEHDIPLQPGEKVDRFRMMSFYLENSTQHFDDFFDYVVDPEWLMSNDEEARALRQAKAGKRNRCWRVLHRVTYIERPALAGLWRDARVDSGRNEMSADEQTAASVREYFRTLSDKQSALEGRLAHVEGFEDKIDEILQLLKNLQP